MLSQPEMEVQLASLSDKDLPGILTEDEQLRRYKDMSRIYGQAQAFPERYTLVLNRGNKSVQAIAAMEAGRSRAC